MKKAYLLPLPAITPVGYAALLSVLLVLLYNAPLWQLILGQHYADNLARWGFVLAFFSFMFAVLQLFLGSLAWHRIIKPLAVALILSSSLVGYFMQIYGIVIDKSMVQNLLQTDIAEAEELLGTGLVFQFLLTGVLPALLFIAIPLKPVPPRRLLLHQLASLFACVTLIGLNAGLLYKEYSSLFRNHREIRNLAVPSNFLYYGTRYLAGAYDPVDRPFNILGGDAVRITADTHAPAGDRREDLLVLVVGETARADHFSLNGYPRNTNPALSQRNVLSFTQVESCGTSTAVSLPCMFSLLGRKRFDDTVAKYQSNVLDILETAGVTLLWRDNNSGCKGVCSRIPSEEPKRFMTQEYCSDQECFDEGMLNKLDRFLASGVGPKLIILHQKGSHGPAYYKRIPGGYRHFTPVCESSELQTCTVREIINAYDNTILYTDHFLAGVIDYLKSRQNRYDTAMLYLSDHGESLGENNLFLHGMPWMLAPETQKHIPMIFWSSPGFERSHGLDDSCLRARLDRPLSHDYLPHSLLGLLQVSTEEYRPALDLFAPCRDPGRQLALQLPNLDKAG